MTATHTRLLFLIVCADVALAFIDLNCKSENHGEYGQQSRVECIIQPKKEAEDPEIIMVTWKKDKDEHPLLLYKKGKTNCEQRYQFAEPEWNNKTMSVSLLVTNTMLEDTGQYRCMVITDSGDASASTELSVAAKYSAPTINYIPEKEIPLNTNSTLFCNSYGGYPQGQIRWFDVDNSELTHSSEMEAKQMPDGLFNLTSKLSLLPDSVFSKPTCVVHSASGSKEGEAIFEMPETSFISENLGQQDSNSKIIAPVVVIGSLIVGLLLVIVLKWRRRDRHQIDPDIDNDETQTMAPASEP
ncbi:CD276 antigen homolog [Lampris incognitus]|uniref:CD276 antigen homolog n=1 Tax=Lampris incognitus TaxID=2546036 RepID=UPI0024B560EC|nr:CD276 antigen homolog [Lampris incognitus]XP_056136249.1 CD276 antigen homolog [Lampris incognitus]XP_056136250.1 CD276 antigen homolog [Lampris incognitus]